MRKEIFGVILIFVLIFVTVSLLSYHPSDPSINHIQTSGRINNLFGPAGAHVAGFLVAVFGLGALCMPLILLVLTIYIFKAYSKGTF
ncbi:MAG: DNA translocase FtsK 4TM domain-containing protein, partial [Deltaproteobacteria bacterium]|nr:DNA translocase FtsK 4TM domain-containing protein [Deltaproteobacteria bacterium]